MKHFILSTLFSLFVLQSAPAQWVSQTSGTTNHLQSVFFTDISTGWACGIGGIMKKTTNGGAVWENQSAGSGTLYEVYFINPSTGWACGIGTIFKTTNGGTNWTLMHTQDQSISSVFFINAQSGWCAGHNGIVRASTDGGTTWELQNSGVSSILSSISFINPSTGWIAGINGIIRKTTNGGTNWLEQPSGITNTLSTIHFINESTGWAAGLNGKIIKTTDAGDTWISQSSGVTTFLTAISFYDENTGWISGERTMLVTTNSGVNWNKQVPGVTVRINQVQFKDKNRGWAVADSGKILVTSIGGFEVAAPSLSSPVNGSLNTSVTPLLQWGSVANSSGYHLQVSTDSNFTSTVINDTTLSAESYTPLPGILSGSTKYYWRVRAKHPAGAGFYSGTWNFTTMPAPSSPNLISPANNSIGQSVNPPLDWDSAGSITAFRVQVSTDSLFITANFDTTLLHSNITVPDGKLLANTKYYWRVIASGSGGSSSWSVVWNFTTTLTGVSQNGSGIPSEYKLYNNYPNPFNPATTISYDLPEAASVKLVVYDILGKEIARLVNEFKPAGSYTIQFNAKGLTSGIYFYSIETQSFKDIKKMLLVK